MAASVFDLTEQHDDPDAKITVALERLMQAFRVMLWEATVVSGLSPIQIQILVFLKARQERCRFGDIADRFDLTPPTVSDALRVLIEKGLVRKEPDPEDRRARVLQLTGEGHDEAGRQADWAECVRRQLAPLPEEAKATTLCTLMDLIAGLQRERIITVARMCTTCRYFVERSSNEEAHYCRLLRRPLAPHALRVDCAEHVPASHP